MASPFVDKVTITVRAGDGGNGAVTFHREKYVAAGGPDGGDGGRGGDIIFEVDDNMSTLMDFRYKRKYVASNGADGQGKRCSGRVGQSLHIRVPRGTLLRDADSGAIMHDMSSGEPFVAARGGRGGWGNQHFATPTRQVPRFAKPGLPGESHTILLELKLLADVGLVGFPNVGKSTLLSVVSKAHPKIANYHFTTLFPNLGVVYVSEGSSFVMADIPGIIEGASDGAGLGHDFLRHIDRCRLLVHLVDVSGSEGRDPVEDFEAINAELRAYSDVLASRTQIVAANKCDLLGDDRTNIDRLRAHVEAQGYAFFEMSAAAHTGTRELIQACAAKLAEIPPVPPYEADYVPPEPEVGTSDELQIRHFDDLWVVEGPWLQRLMSTINFGDYESRMYFDRVLRQSGLFDRLEAMGIEEGDTANRIIIGWQNYLKFLMELFLHLACPLGHQTSRANNENPTNKTTALQFTDDHTSFNRLTKTNFIRQNIANVVGLHCTVQHMELVRQGNNSAGKRRKKATGSFVFDFREQRNIAQIIFIILHRTAR